MTRIIPRHIQIEIVALVEEDEDKANLPEEWFSCSTVKDGLIDNIVTQLNSYKDQKFWEPLQ